ncbi:MAG: response regulator [Paracoccaceae bacterium]
MTGNSAMSSGHPHLSLSHQFASISGLTALVAEDDPSNRLILGAMLTTLGVEAILVGDGDEAVATWRRRQFDVLLFDISMPKTDGRAALRTILNACEANGAKAPPAIAVTAHAMRHQLDEYLAAGFAACVVKPIRIQGIAAAIAKSTGRAG